MNPDGGCLVFVGNFIGNQHEEYTVPVPFAGSYKEVLNTDAAEYTGSNYVNSRAIRSKKGKVLNEENYIKVKLAPFAKKHLIVYVKQKQKLKKKQEKKLKKKQEKKLKQKLKKKLKIRQKQKLRLKKLKKRKQQLKKKCKPKQKVIQ